MRQATRAMCSLLMLVFGSAVVYGQTVSRGGVVNAASYQAPVAPGSVVSIFGSELASATSGAPAVPLPLNLGGTSVLVNGRPAPLFFVSPSQINAQVPYETSTGAATLVVSANGSSSAPAAFEIAASAPGIVMYARNRAVALNQDGTLNSPEHPSQAGGWFTVYMTGQGQVDVPVTTGAASPANPPACPRLPVTATVGEKPAEVLFAGLSPGGVGLFQVNLRTPVLPSGDFPLVVTVGSSASNAATIAVAGSGELQPGSSIVRTMVYHQLTSLPDDGPDHRSSTVLSGNGRVIAFTYAPGTSRATSPNRVYVMNFDGAGQRQIDSYTTLCYCGSILDISDDGTKVVSTEGRQVRIVDDRGARGLVTVDTGVSGLKIQGDGRRVFFMLDRDGYFVGSGASTPAQRGLYVINADGSGLRQIVGPAAVASAFGTTANSSISPQFAVTGNAANHSLGVSRDGTQIVFGAQKAAQWGPDAIFGVNPDGSGLRMLIGPVAYVKHLGISADGSKILYSTSPSGALVDEIGVAGFDGSGRRVLRNDGSPSAENPLGAAIQLTADGSLLLAYDMLYNTDGSGVLQLSTTSNSLTPGRPVMNATATRFVYAFVFPGTYSQGLTQLASLEINPLSLGSAPVIVNPAVNPAYVIPNGSFKATATAGVTTSSRVLGVSYALVREGRVERPYNGDVFLVDDRTWGDQVAADGVYTSNAVRSATESPAGPRLLRLFAQILDGAGKRHATLIDLAPFFNLLQAPTGPAPRIDAITPASGAGGSQVTISGTGFDSEPANNQVIIGLRLARVVSASPTQLVVIVPADCNTGESSVIAAAQGQASSQATFIVR